MKIGILADLNDMRLDAWLSTYALQEALQEMGHMSVVIHHSFPNSVGVNEIGTKEISYEYYNVVEGSSQLGENIGFYNLLDVYLVADERMWKKVKDAVIKEYYPIHFWRNSIILLQQKRYHPLARKRLMKEEYLLSYYECPSKEKLEFINYIVDEKKLKLVSNEMEGMKLTSLQSYTDQDIKEFLSYLRHAKVVITDSGFISLMALLYEKPFLLISDENKEVLAVGILKEIGLANIILSDISILNEISYYDTLLSTYENNQEEFRSRIRSYREECKKKLRHALRMASYEIHVDCPTDIKKMDCCGCSACMEVCPYNAIDMKADEEGFIYPVVNDSKCVKCMLCKKICVKRENPQTVVYEKNYPIIYAVNNKKLKVRENSSSGGIFPELVQYVIEELNGYVVGVKFDDDMRAVSSIAHTMEEAKEFYGAKYTKSDFTGIFRKVKKLLDSGKTVLYSSLPCEAAGLRAFLRKKYENLIVCEVLCHAGPSPLVFRRYVEYLEKRFKSKVKKINFRDKSKGWLALDNSMVIEFSNRKPLRVNARRNNYYRSFIKDNIARPACSNCSFVYTNRVGDLTLGDFWGIQYTKPEMFDNKGTSILMINTSLGENIWNKISNRFEFEESNLKEAFRYNHKKPIKLTEKRNEFFERFEKEEINALLEEFNDLK